LVGGDARTSTTFASTRTRAKKSLVNLGQAIKTLVHVHGLQMIKDRVFNLDCHGGNVLILPDKCLGLLDYGMVGHLEDEEQMNVANKTIVYLSQKDKVQVAQIYTDSGYQASWKEGNVPDTNIILIELI
jgi:predicted unusual protein kinase regulating ubiquinone biosynthesis (AarF/ABC1/UbiB family)